jgi:hypothetical protein
MKGQELLMKTLGPSGQFKNGRHDERVNSASRTTENILRRWHKEAREPK